MSDNTTPVTKEELGDYIAKLVNTCPLNSYSLPQAIQYMCVLQKDEELLLMQVKNDILMDIVSTIRNGQY